MKQHTDFWVKSFMAMFVIIGAIAIIMPCTAQAETVEELSQRVAYLEKELSNTQGKLKIALQSKGEINEKTPDKIMLGPIKIGGAIRANYILGDYERSTRGPSRGGHGGDFELDLFRVNADWNQDAWTAKVEYRFYPGYNMLHTGWLSYEFEDKSSLKGGVNRVPFGPGPYGVSQSWFFDQHYYVGLADDMDFGLHYKKPLENLTLDFGYYPSNEGHWNGSTSDSTRYSYDVVNESGSGYDEEHQFNARAIYNFNDWTIPSDIGVSVQYGLLDSQGLQGDGNHSAASVHMINKWNNFKLASQLSYYKYDIENHPVESGVVSDDLIDFGAFDFAYPIAAEAFVPGISLSYNLKTPSVSWIDSITPYIEYSSIIKEAESFRDSELFIIGAAWARGNWYINTDLGYSNGNFFVGNEAFTEFGANPNDRWQKRLNIHFGYYF
ncbi:MAG: hypothetical protein ACI9Y8_001465 [Candidatus Omnitrophota bacterium]|jgi:hypothetical protein